MYILTCVLLDQPKLPCFFTFLHRTVTRLTLYNCDVDLDMIMGVVTQLDNLQVLDISKEGEPTNVDFRWKVENKDLKSLSTLPSLTDLDLSGMLAMFWLNKVVL